MKKYKIEYDKGKARLLSLIGFGLSGIYIGNVLQALLFFSLHIGLIALCSLQFKHNIYILDKDVQDIYILIAFIVIKVSEYIITNENISKEKE